MTGLAVAYLLYPLALFASAGLWAYYTDAPRMTIAHSVGLREAANEP